MIGTEQRARAARWCALVAFLGVAAPARGQPDTAEERAEAESDVLVTFERGEGPRVRTRDGRFDVRLSLRAQFLFRADREDDGDLGFDLTVRRARVLLEGAVFDPDLRYRLQLGVSPNDMELEGGYGQVSPLLDLWVESRHLRDLQVRVGQFVMPFDREWLTSTQELHLVERSIVADEMGIGRDVGITLHSEDFLGQDALRYWLGVSSGQGRDAPLSPGESWLYHARFEVHPLGLWDDRSQGDLERRADPRLALGVAYAFHDQAPFERGLFGDQPRDGGTTSMHLATLDAQLAWAGLTLIGALSGRIGWRHPGDAIDEDTGLPIAPEDPRNGWGALAQVGWVLPWIPIEIAARYATVQPFAAPTSLRARHEAGGGLVGYIEEHLLKVMLDVFARWGDDAPEQRLQLMLQAVL